MTREFEKITGSKDTQECLGLALSGGGFRATLFHLGVVRALAEAGLLSRISHITSVSGGSVLAAHMVLNWDKYRKSSELYREAFGMDPGTGDVKSDEASRLFEEASQPLLDFIAKDIRNRIIRRLPLMWLVYNMARLPVIRQFRWLEQFTEQRFRSISVLEGQLNVLYGEKTLDKLKADGRPELAILATEAASMECGRFTHEGYSQPRLDRSYGGDLISVARAVAASAAFPGLFTPVRIDSKWLEMPDQRDLFLIDAGVYDNLGLSGFMGTPYCNAGCRVFVSDATATTEWLSGSMPGFIGNLHRSIDIIQQRAAQFQRASAQLPQRDPIHGTAANKDCDKSNHILIDIAQDNIKCSPMIPPTAQQRASYVRTDLDAFGSEEMRYITHHGHSVAWHTIKDLNLVAAIPNWCTDLETRSWPSPRPKVDEAKVAAKKLLAGRNSSLNPFQIFSPSDPVPSGIYLILLMAALLGIWNLLNADDDILRQYAITTIDDAINNSEAAVEDYASFDPPFESLSDAMRRNQNISISSQAKLIDLRKWKRDDAWKSMSIDPSAASVDKTYRPLESASQQTTYYLRRLDKAATTAVFRHRTSGYGIIPKLRWEDYNRIQYYSSKPTDPKYRLYLDAAVDIGQYPVNSLFPVFIPTTYWNAYQEQVEDVSFLSYTKDSKGTVIVLFPESRIPRMIAFWQKKASEPLAIMPKPPIYVFHKSGLYFEITGAEKDCSYGVQFSWDDAGVGDMNKVRPILSHSLLSK